MSSKPPTLILAEDTRTSKVLLNHFGIEKTGIITPSTQ
jgi:16S rRNA C1402 (ribose-2'-O) methylase RsmI